MSAETPFSQFLMEQRRGALHGELSDRLRELVAAVVEHEKAGTLTVTLSVKPAGYGVGQYVVTDDVKVKAPEANREASLFFADEDGNLTRTNPLQPSLPLQEVPRTESEAL